MDCATRRTTAIKNVTAIINIWPATTNVSLLMHFISSHLIGVGGMMISTYVMVFVFLNECLATEPASQNHTYVMAFV